MAINLTDPTPEDDDTYPPAYRELVEPSQPSPKLIRAWAINNGWPKLAGRNGRLPKAAVADYWQAHGVSIAGNQTSEPA